MITEKAYGAWSVIRDGKLITALRTVTGTGAQQITSMGDATSQIAQFMRYPVKILKIIVNFQDYDNKAIEIDHVPLSNSEYSTILLNVAATTNRSHPLDAEPGNVDVYSTPFRLDFIVTYTGSKKYDINVKLEEVGE